MNDMRLGDLDALLDKFLRSYTEQEKVGNFQFVACEIKQNFADMVCEQPTIDAVPVVRCWNCGHGLRCVDGYVRCSHPSGKVILMKSGDFCSYGERKEADGNG